MYPLEIRKIIYTTIQIENLTFYEQHQIPLLRILTDRGTEYCGAREHHEYELYLAIEDFDHSRTKAKSPQTNGFCERFHRTIQDEFYAIAFRKKVYTGLEELQKDLGLWLENYNHQRPHSGKYCFGKTPYQTFLETIPLAKEKMLHNLVEDPLQHFFSEPALTPPDEGMV